jgi:inorganic triphosphatase YgiF
MTLSSHHGQTSPEAPEEVELKLAIDAGDIDALGQSPLLSGVASEDRELFATYYDTDDGDLRIAGLSLRIRRVGERFIQTLKAGSDGGAALFARTEWERDVAGPSLVVESSSPLRRLVGFEIIERLEPVFTAAVTRRTWTLRRGESVIELVADRGAVIAGDRINPVSEIELELREGGAADIIALARDLGESVSLRLGVLTKSERGYRLIGPGGGAAVKATGLDLAPDATVAEAFAAIVGDCLRDYRLNEDLLRREPRPDTLHQARVALRRLRSAMSIFKPVVADDRFAHLARELRHISRPLGAARDLDVLIGRLGGAASEELSEARSRAYEAAMTALESQRTRDLMLDLVEWTLTGEWRNRPAGPGSASSRADAFAARVLDRLHDRIGRHGRHLDRIHDERRHRARILTKKLRYATGFFASLFTGGKAQRRVARFLAPLEALQEHLGDLNDLATAPKLLGRFGLPAETTGSRNRRERLLRKAAKAEKALAATKRYW